MKKLNNKGFAVSTLLYGLMLVAFLVVSILISIMSTNRKNTSTLVKKIEEELNRYSQTATEFTSTDGAQEFIVPYGKAGWYKIELWGASAANVDSVADTENGRGAYTAGIIYLEENTHLYFQIGSQGGAGGIRNNIGNTRGGGSTDVRLQGGSWNDTAGQASRIMVAAGGTFNNSHKGSGYGYGVGEDSYYSFKYPNGYYDGGSFIAGYAGQSPVIYTDPIIETTKTYAFISTMMVSGVNAEAGKARIELISTQDASNPPAKKTNYLNSVRYIINCVQFQNSQSKEVWREIVAIDQNGVNVAQGKPVRYGSGNDTDPWAYAYLLWPSIGGLTDNLLDPINLSSPKTVNDIFRVSGTYNVCVSLDLGTYHNLEEIRIFHSNPDKTGQTANYHSESLDIISSDRVRRNIRNASDRTYTPTETYMGVSFSDRNPTHTTNAVIPAGNYYIQSALSDNRFLTVKGGVGRIALFSGDKLQRWSVTSVGGINYKILEGAEQKALQPQHGGQSSGEAINALSQYQEYNWEKWQIISVGNGYYQFKTSANANLCMSTKRGDRDTSYRLEMLPCDSSNRQQWFKLINADY